MQATPLLLLRRAGTATAAVRRRGLHAACGPARAPSPISGLSRARPIAANIVAPWLPPSEAPAGALAPGVREWRSRAWERFKRFALGTWAVRTLKGAEPGWRAPTFLAECQGAFLFFGLVALLLWCGVRGWGSRPDRPSSPECRASQLSPPAADHAKQDQAQSQTSTWR